MPAAGRRWSRSKREEEREIARGTEEDRAGRAVGRRGLEGTVVQSAIRTPGKGTDRYWGKLGCGGGVFSFSEGAPPQPPSEGGKRRTKRRTRTRTRRKRGEGEQTNGSRRRRWRENSPFCVPDCEGLGRRVRRREEEPRRADRDPLCNISSIDHYTHRRRAVPSHPCPRRQAASRQPLVHTLSLSAHQRARSADSLFRCEGPSPTPSSSTLDSGNRPSRETRHW